MAVKIKKPSAAERRKFKESISEPENIDDVDLDNDIDNVDLDDDSNDAENVQQIVDPFLADPVVENDYTKLDAEVVGEMPDEIPEPNFVKPKIDFNHSDEILSDDQPSEDENEKTQKEPPLKSPGWDDMDARQKKASASYLAETAINAYVMLNNLGKRWCTFSQEKLQNMALDGKIDLAILEVELPMSETESVTIGEFLDGINNQAEQVFTVSDEFKETAKPLLIEIFKKKGWGLTVEQRLLALIIEDAAPKVAIAFSIQSQFKQLIKVSMALLNEGRQPNRGGEYTNQSPQNDPDSKTETLIPEPVDNNNDNND